MAQMTNEEVYRLVISIDAPADFQEDILKLQRAGRFSAGAKILIHRMQNNPRICREIAQRPNSLVDLSKDLGLKDYEAMPIALLSIFLQEGVGYKPRVRPLVAVMPGREDARKRFAGQNIRKCLRNAILEFCWFLGALFFRRYMTL